MRRASWRLSSDSARWAEIACVLARKRTSAARVWSRRVDSETELSDGADGADFVLAVDAATLASAEVTGTFARV